MSILIKGMEMPKDVTLIAISTDGTVDIISGQPDLSWVTLKDKAIPIPDHGDLIDRDELLKERPFKSLGEYNSDGCFVEEIGLYSTDQIADVATIIPADKEDGE